LVFTIGATGLKKFVYESGFTVVNVGDDGEVTELGHDGGKWNLRAFD
jgi:hypothetical protein